MKTSRNDPCPCGSGKKYKRCCLTNNQAAQLIDNEWRRLRQIEGEMVHLLLHMTHDLFGDDFLEQAWQEYTSVSREPIPLEEAPEAGTSFVPWAVFDYVPRSENGETGEQPKLPMALSFLLVANDELEPDEKQFIVEMSEQPYSFWSVQEVEPGKSLKLKDIFTHTERTVKELQASEVLGKGDIVYTRVLSLGSVAIMVGLAPFPFPPGYHFDFLEAREILFGRRLKITLHDLSACEPLLRQLYCSQRHRLLNPVVPVLQNTDGDPLEFVKLTYRLNYPPQTVFEKLCSLNSLESGEDLLNDAELDDSGVLRKVAFSWMAQGNKMHRSWDNTILGNITIENEQLVIEVNSAKRSQKIQKEIARRLGDGTVLQDSATESMEQKLAETRAGKDTEAQQRAAEEQEALMALPEVQAQMKEMAKQRWENWLDEPLPVLQGKTPKQAARSAAGRERLEALLIDFERSAESLDPIFAPDVKELRRLLKLSSPAKAPKAEQVRKKSAGNTA
jgi:hypothetical protein